MEDFTNDYWLPQTFSQLENMNLEFDDFTDNLQRYTYDSVASEHKHDSAPFIDAFNYGQGYIYQQQNAPLAHNLPSARSSASSNLSFSDSSVFSQQLWRGSVASTNSTLSTISESSRGRHISQTHRILNSHSTATPSPRAPVIQKEAQLPLSRQPSQRQADPAKEQLPLSRQPSQRQPDPAKEQFSTCVSRKKRSRRSTKEPRYWCTICKEGFVEKYDWKRHEETFQERCETYQCELCNKKYFLEKDFIHHHRESHRCKTCVENKHVEIARRRQRTRTGWGCGFCLRFDSDWTERCNHIASHFEKDGDTIDNWNQTKVIYSLLQQPALKKEWFRLLDTKQEKNPQFYWSERRTGRAEGYPDSDRSPQLQDLLEFYTPDQSASALVAYAYEMGHRTYVSPSQNSSDLQRHASEKGHTGARQGRTHRQKSPPTSRHPSPPNKELPRLPPQVPSTKSYNGAGATYRSDSVHWDSLISTIPEDNFLPDSDPMAFSEFYVGGVGAQMAPDPSWV